MAAVTRLGLYGGTRSPYGSFEGKTEQEDIGGGVVAKRKIKRVDRNFFPWTQQPDPIEEEFVKELKKKPKLKIVKKAPQPDFDSTLEAERLDRELVEELKRVEKERKDRARRHKKAIMLLLS